MSSAEALSSYFNIVFDYAVDISLTGPGFNSDYTLSSGCVKISEPFDAVLALRY